MKTVYNKITCITRQKCSGTTLFNNIMKWLDVYTYVVNHECGSCKQTDAGREIKTAQLALPSMMFF